MRKLFITTLALVVCNVILVPRNHFAAKASHSGQAYAPGEVIVKLRPGTSEQTLSDFAAGGGNSAGETFVRPVGEPLEPIARRTGSSRLDRITSDRGLDRTYVFKVDPDDDIDLAINRLAANPSVEYAEPNYLIKLGSVLPDDPKFKEQWALRNLGIGVTGYPATLDADIKATEAWTITMGGPEVLVAVADTGVDVGHPDLTPNIYTNPREIPNNGVDDDKNGYVDDVNGYNVADSNGDVSDIVGHGTQMAGIIAARTNNLTGISGISQARILPVKFFKRTGPAPADFTATVADAARSLMYALAAGASIVNASWTTHLSPADQQSHALEDAVAATEDAGVLLVCIAGNDALNNDVNQIYPGAYELSNQIVVAASEYNDELWHPPFDPDHIFSGYGKNTVHLAAPGMAVFTTFAGGSCVLCSPSEDPEDWYGNVDGTSAAAACVSGVAALVKSQYPDDYVTVIKRRILEGVDVRASLQPYVITGGRLNAYNALTVPINLTPPTLTNLKYKPGSGKLFLYGEQIQRGAFAIVGQSKFKAKFKGGDLSRVVSSVPASALPVGTPVLIRILNPDGGSSQPLTFTR